MGSFSPRSPGCALNDTVTSELHPVSRAHQKKTETHQKTETQLNNLQARHFKRSFRHLCTGALPSSGLSFRLVPLPCSDAATLGITSLFFMLKLLALACTSQQTPTSFSLSSYRASCTRAGEHTHKARKTYWRAAKALQPANAVRQDACASRLRTISCFCKAMRWARPPNLACRCCLCSSSLYAAARRLHALCQSMRCRGAPVLKCGGRLLSCELTKAAHHTAS